MNTRRSGTSVGNVGQRRPQAQQVQNMANNFVPGGQMKPQQHPIINMPANPQLQAVGPQKLQQQATAQQNTDADIKSPIGVIPSRPSAADQGASLKQEPIITPVKPPSVSPATQSAPVRPQKQGALQMQKLTPQQQQAIKQQQALRQQVQTMSAGTSAITTTTNQVCTEPKQDLPQQQPQVVQPQPPVVQSQPPVVQSQPPVVQPQPLVVQPQQYSLNDAPVEKELQQTIDDNLKSATPMEVVGSEMKIEEAMTVDIEMGKKKPRWMTNKGSSFPRISKADKIKRLNARFRKFLQPKNALMILNEMNGSTQYNFMDLGSLDNPLKNIKHSGGFKAVTLVDGVEYFGVGADKVTAKSNAAEAAIKSIVLRKILNTSVLPKQHITATLASFTADGSYSNMDNTESVADGNNGDAVDNGNVVMSDGSTKVAAVATAAIDGLECDVVPWMHIASFALHKLFNSWEETGTLLRASSQGNLTDIASETYNSSYAGSNALLTNAMCSSSSSVHTHIPQRILPENALNMHPVMLLNQMRPGSTHYNEQDMIGAPPQTMYSYECVVEGKGGFIGRGPNKKIARRNAAYVACQDILELTYPQDIMHEIVQSSEPRKLQPIINRAQRHNKQQQQQHHGGPGGGYFVRESPQGDNSLGNDQEMDGADGYNTGIDPGYKWY